MVLDCDNHHATAGHRGPGGGDVVNQFCGHGGDTEFPGSQSARSQIGISKGAVGSTRDGGVGEDRVHVGHHRGLQNSDRAHREDDAHTNKFDRRTAPIVGVGHMVTTREIADSKTALSAGPATAQMTTTSPAVISVINTHPGTSPRSDDEVSDFMGRVLRIAPAPFGVVHRLAVTMRTMGQEKVADAVAFTATDWLSRGIVADPTTREKMIMLAIDEIADVGPADFSAMHVCDRLGIRHPMVNHHFGNRDGLLAEATWWAYQDWSRHLRAAVASAPANPEKRLRAFIREEIAWASRMRGMYLLVQYPLASNGAQELVAERYGDEMEAIFEHHLALLAVIVSDLRNGTVSNVSFEVSETPTASLMMNPSAVFTAGHLAWMMHGLASWSSGHHISTRNYGKRGIKGLTLDLAVAKYIDLIVSTAKGS